MMDREPRDGYELIHWMGDGGTKGMWVGTGLREGKSGSHVARTVARRKSKIKNWRNILKRETDPKKNGCVKPIDAMDKPCASFHTTTVSPQGITLTCYITGHSLPVGEIQRCYKLREDLMRKCLVEVGVDDDIIEFQQPNSKPPNISLDDLQGVYGDENSQAIQIYNDEAQHCYKLTMQAVVNWASENIRDGSAKVNKAVLDAIPEIRHASSKMAQEPPLVIIEFPETFEARKELFTRIGVNKKGEVEVEKCQDAVSDVDTEFDHNSAVLRAFKLADRSKTGSLSLNEDQQECEFSHYLKYLEKYTTMLQRVGERFKGRTFESSEWERLAPEVISDDKVPHSQITEMFNDLDSDKTGLVEVHEIIMFAAKVTGDIDLSTQEPKWVSPARSASWREAVADWTTTAVAPPKPAQETTPLPELT